ncbi:MAG: tRNA pseudouridine(55) synthase TruB [Flavobacteriales bacterium]
MTPWNKESLDFLEGQLILIDKPYGWTSFDAVKKVRYLIRKKLDLKKIKVGHAGTLDPLATGLLVIATGRFTKKIDELMDLEKRYTGTITLGASTPSFDLETEEDQFFEYTHLTQEELITAKSSLSGTQDQVPPIFSAKKVNGRRAYTLARAGKPVELKSKAVEIKSFDITDIRLPHICFDIKCTKGTYIRSIARDMGLELNNGAHLTSLRREGIGSYEVSKAFTPESFEHCLTSL